MIVVGASGQLAPLLEGGERDYFLVSFLFHSKSVSCFLLLLNFLLLFLFLLLRPLFLARVTSRAAKKEKALT